MANNVYLHGMKGYHDFLVEFTETAQKEDPSHKDEVQNGVDSLLQARTLEAAHEALRYLNQFMGSDTFELQEVAVSARLSKLPSKFTDNFYRLWTQEPHEKITFIPKDSENLNQ